MITRDHNSLIEFPFKDGVFSRNTVNNSNVLIDRKETKEVILTVDYDIQIATKDLQKDFFEANYVIYFPIEKKSDGIKIKRGDLFSGDMYGLRVNGEVLVINPSELGAVAVYIKDIDV